MLKKASRILVAFVFAFGPNLLAPEFVSAVSNTPVSGTPSAPDSVGVTAGAANLTVSWSAPVSLANQVTGYQVEYSTSGLEGSWQVASSTINQSATSYTISGLLVGNTSYYVRVAAKTSSGLGAYGYPWTKVYGTVTPTRNSGTITYQSGFGLGVSDAAQQNINANFTRVRYLMKANYSNLNRSVDADFYKDVNPKTSYSESLDSVAFLQIPTISGSGVGVPSQFEIHGNVSDLTVLSNDSNVSNGHGLSGRLEIWPWNYSTTAPDSTITERSPGGIYDDADYPAFNSGYGSFQLHNLTTTNGYSKQTIFAWNRHESTEEIGFGNYLGGNTDWTFCANAGASPGCSNRTGFSLEIYINKPVMTLAGYTLTFDSLGGSSVATQSFAPNSTISSAPVSPTKSGSTFFGWSETSGGKTKVNFPYSPGSNNRTLYAIWEVNPNPPTPNYLIANNNSLVIRFTGASAASGAAPITGYQYTTDDGVTWSSLSGLTSPQVISTTSSGAALAEGTSYSIKLRSTNGVTNSTATSGVTAVYKNKTIFDATNFSLSGTAGDSAVFENGSFRLTQATGARYGTAWNQTRIDLTKDFVINASVFLGTDDAGADGLAFVIQPNSTGAGKSGGGLGYEGITPSFSVEFDTYQNGSEPAYDHIAYMKNGDTGNHNNFSATGAISSGAWYNTGLNLEDGVWRDVRFIYKSSTSTFITEFAGTPGSSTQSQILSANVDLGALIGGNKIAYWGFTAATGGAVNEQRVQVYDYTIQLRSNTAPSINSLSNVTVLPSTSSNSFAFTYSDDLSEVSQTSVSATSSNKSVIPDANISTNLSSKTAGTIAISSTSTAGTSQITLNIKDADGATGTTSFNVTVFGSANAPSNLILTPGDRRIDASFTGLSSSDLFGGTLTRYEYQLNTGLWTSIGTSTSFSVTSGISNNTQYTVKVRAVSTYSTSTLNGTASSTVSVTPNQIPQNSITPSLSLSRNYPQTATASPESWTGAGITYSYQWQVSDTSSSNGTWTNISGATASTYLTNSAIANKYLRVIVTATNSAGSTSATSLASTSLLGPSPVNISAPSTSGTTRVDSTLTASDGDWTVTDATFTYQWFRSDIAIPGATNKTYVLTPDDALANIKVRVIAENPFGSATAFSSATTAIAKNNQTLTFTNPGTKAYSLGSTSITAQSDKGLEITFTSNSTSICKVGSGTLSGNTTTATVTFVRAGTCSISGSQVGNDGYNSATFSAQTFTISVSTPSVPQNLAATVSGTTATITWDAPTTDGGSAITGYTITGTGANSSKTCTTNGAANSCQITGLAAGTSYSFTATATNGTSTSSSSSATNSITAYAAASAPTSLSTTIANQQIDFSFTGVSGSGLNGGTLTRYEYKVEYYNSSNVLTSYLDWTSNDTSVSKTFTDLANGTIYRITVRAITEADQGNGTLVSLTGATAYVEAQPNTPPVNTAPPSFTGTAQYGQSLSVNSTGTWTGGNNSFTYQWQRAASDQGPFSDISGATLSTYTAGTDDLGKYLRVSVIATNNTGTSTVVYSGSSLVVVDQSASNTVVPAISGTVTVDSTLSATSGTWDGTRNSYAYQWLRATTSGGTYSEITGATSSTYTLTTDDGGKFLKVRVTATNTAGSATAFSSATTAIAKNNQTLTFTNPGTKAYSLGSTSITAQSDKGLEITFTSNSTSICKVGSGTLSGNTTTATVTFVRAGTCSISGSQVGNDGYNSATFSAQTFTISVSTPSVPQNLAATVSGTTATITWDAPTTDGGSAITGYTITGTGANSSKTCTTNGAANSCQITGLAAGTSYSFTATATNGTSTSSSSSATNSITAYAAASAPTSLSTTIANQQIDFSFTGVSGSGLNGGTLTRYEYKVEYYNSSNVLTSYLDWTSNDTSVSKTFTGLANGTIYRITVRAITEASQGNGTTVSLTGATAYVEAQPNVRPDNLTDPLITGTMSYGQVVSISSIGEWKGGNNSFTYQWQRASSDQGPFSDIENANNSTYLLGADDLDRYIRVEITASNNTGQTGRGYSGASNKIIDSAITMTQNPALSSDRTVATKITLAAGSWSSSRVTKTYQWLSADTFGGVYAEIPGANFDFYTPGISDGGKYLKLEITVSNTYENATYVAGPTAQILKATQTISNFGDPGTQDFSDGSVVVSVTNDRSLTTSFTSANNSVCTVGSSTPSGQISSATVLFISAGSCSITASHLGNQGYFASNSLTRSFNIAASNPSAPTGITAKVLGTSATATWSAPASTGGSPITSYTAEAEVVGGGQAKSCTTSGLTCEILDLQEGTEYEISVTASNSTRTSASSSPVVRFMTPTRVVSVVTGEVPRVVPAKAPPKFLGEVSNTVKNNLLNSGVVEPPVTAPVNQVKADLGGSTYLVPTAVTVTQTVESGSKLNLLVVPPANTPADTALFGTLRLADGTTYDLGEIRITEDQIQNGVGPNPFSILPVGTHVIELKLGRILNQQALAFGRIGTGFFVPVMNGADEAKHVIKFEITVIAPNGVPEIEKPATPTPTPSTSATPTPSPTKSVVKPTPEPTTSEPTTEPTAEETPLAEATPEPSVDERGLEVVDPVADAPAQVAQTTVTAVTLVAAVTAAASAAAAVAGAAGAAAGAAGAAAGGSAGSSSGGSSGRSGGSASGSSGSSSSSGASAGGEGEGEDDASLEGIDFEHEGFEIDRNAWGDNLKAWSIPFLRLLDQPSHNATEKLAPISPLVSKLISDGAYLRAIFGTIAAILPALGIALGLIGVQQTGGLLVPPPAWIVAAIACIGIFDALAGFLGMFVFSIGMSLTVGLTSAADVRMMLGLFIIGFGPALLAGAFRALRKPPADNFAEWWERFTDLAIAPFLGAWATKGMVEALPALAGVKLPIAESANTIAWIVAFSLVTRVLLEEFTSRFFPSRLNFIHPTDVASPSNLQKSIALAMRAFIFWFVAGAFIGTSWHLYVGTALFIAPSYLGLLQDKFPNYPKLYQILPAGLPGLAFTLLVASYSLAGLTAILGETPDLAKMAFVLLPIPSVILSILGMLGREPADGDVRWYQRDQLTWLYRIGGIAIFIYTLQLTGII